MSRENHDNIAPGELRLFVCCTPLQAEIAAAIIEMEQLPREQCAVFLYTSFDSAQYRHYYRRLRRLCSKGHYFVWRPGFWSYFRLSRRVLARFQPSVVYMASIDSFFAQYAASLPSVRAVHTFDDGSVNLVPSSRYLRHRAPLLKRVAWWLGGNRLSAEGIRRRARTHFTIYDIRGQFDQASVRVPMFWDRHPSRPTQRRCVVLLGTVLREISKGGHTHLLAELKELLHTVSAPVFFIPHPRGDFPLQENVRLLDGVKIAEEKIFGLLEQFDQVEIWGFSSSVQINLATVPGISNRFLSFPGEPQWMSEVRDLVVALGDANVVPLGGAQA